MQGKKQASPIKWALDKFKGSRAATHCRQCRQAFGKSILVPGAIALLCESCKAGNLKAERDKKNNERLQVLAESVPADFRAAYSVAAIEETAKRLRGSQLLRPGPAFGLVLYGGTGTGKTTGAHKICAFMGLSLGYTCELFSVYDLGAMLKDDENFNTRGRPAYQKLMSIDLLIVDDAGDEKNAQQKTAVEFVLTERHKHQKPVIITTNLDLPGFKNHYGQRLFSRYQGQKWLNYGSDDFRQTCAMQAPPKIDGGPIPAIDENGDAARAGSSEILPANPPSFLKARSIDK